MLKAITLFQPYATFMAIEEKRNETRGKRISYRGEIAIHAGLHILKELSVEVEIHLRRLRLDRGQLPMGYILGVCDLYDCIPTEAIHDSPDVGPVERCLGNYQPHRFFYPTRNMRALPIPVPCRGLQALPWTVPEDVEALVRRQLAILDEPEELPVVCHELNGDQSEPLGIHQPK